LIYESTSYVEDNEPISIQLVQSAFAKLNYRIGNHLTAANDDWPADDPVAARGPTSSGNARNMCPTALHAFLRSMATEGDIVLPIELCVLRRGETFREWTARARRCSIEAARQATGGTMQTVAKRLGLTHGSLKSHLHRARRAQSEALFDWQRESD
jgi:hypothetical protein